MNEGICKYLDELIWEYAQLCQRKDGSIYGIASGKQGIKENPLAVILI
jgi:hypothetical protein